MRENDHVLVVDRDRENRSALCSYLENKGLRTTGVADDREMRSALARFTPDLVVLDIMQSGDDGLALCREIRSGSHQAMPILILAARDDETDRVVGLELGADECVPKVFPERTLLARVRTMLRRTRMSRPPMRALTFSADRG
jgi:two-component system OmpR family response regulator